MGGIPLVFSSLCVYRIFHEINHPAITSGVLLYIIYPNYYLDMIPLLYYKYIIYIYITNGLEILLQYISICLYYIYLYIYTIYTYIYYIYINIPSSNPHGLESTNSSNLGQAAQARSVDPRKSDRAATSEVRMARALGPLEIHGETPGRPSIVMMVKGKSTINGNFQ